MGGESTSVLVQEHPQVRHLEVFRLWSVMERENKAQQRGVNQSNAGPGLPTGLINFPQHFLHYLGTLTHV